MSHDDGKIRSDSSLVPSAIGRGSAFAVGMSDGDVGARVPREGRRNMQGLTDRLGEGVLNIIAQIVPWAAELEDHSVLIGRCVIAGFTLVVIWSLSGIVRK